MRASPLGVRAIAIAGLVGMTAAPGNAEDFGALRSEGQVAFTEGPAWHEATGNVYFSDIENNRIMRLDPSGKIHIFRTPSGRANGLAFDARGRLVACEGGNEGGNRRLTRTEADGTVTVLTDRYENKRYNSPNDLAIDAKGRIFFTDPRYGDRSDIEQINIDGRPIEGVYRIDPDGRVHRVILHDVDRPNGIGLSPDGRRLYVADNVNSGPNEGVGGNRKLWCFELTPGGEVVEKSRRLLFDWGTERGPDGLAVAPNGDLYVAAGFNFPNPPAETAEKFRAGIYVLSPETGELKRFYPVPADMITNCAFGGADGKTLYITAGHMLWSLRVE